MFFWYHSGSKVLEIVEVAWGEGYYEMVKNLYSSNSIQYNISFPNDSFFW